MRESKIEKYLKDEVEKRGGLCFKFVSPGYNGVSDRIVISAKGCVHFVEAKRPKGGRFSRLQVEFDSELNKRGLKVRTVFTYDLVDNFVREL